MKKEGFLIIYASPNGRDQWLPVLPNEVPEWLKEEDTLGELVAGQMCSKCDEADPVWYRAEEIHPPMATYDVQG